MKKRIVSFVLMLAVVVSMAVVPVAAETTLNDAAEMYADVLQDYAEKTVKEKLGHSYSFALAYIDEDDVPEMIVCYDHGQLTSATVYSIKNQELINADITASFGNLYFVQKKNIIRTLHSLMFNEDVYFSSFQAENGFSTLHAFECYNNQNYSIDGNEVSKEYYNNELNAMTDAYDWVTFSPYEGDSFEVTTSNIADMKENPTKYILGYDPITVYLNGVQLSFDQPPVMMNDRVLVPMRAIFEAMGAAVTWYDDTQTVVAEKNGRVCSMTIGVPEIKCTANGKTETTALDVAPQLVGDRTMVPVRAVAEAFSAEVTWNDSEQSVNIKSN